MATCDDPPVLLDALKLLALTNSSASLDQKITDSDATGVASGETGDDHTLTYEDDNEESDEDEDEIGGEMYIECRYDEEGEVIECFNCIDDVCWPEDEGRNVNPCVDVDYDGPDIDKNLFIFRGSDESFEGSTLEERRKRRFLIGTHSFLDLADPHLEDALGDPSPPDELKVPDGDDEEYEDHGGEGEGNDMQGLGFDFNKTCITLKEEKDYYKQLCAELGVHPDPYVMANLRSRVMDLRNRGMNAKEIAAVCKLLIINRYVQVLILAGNIVGMEGGMALAELMTKNTTIVEYDLAGTEILESFDIVCAAASENLVIQSLNFSKNELEDVDMPSIKNILKGNPPLLALDLSANLINDNGLRHIGLGILENENLEAIDVSHNKIRAEKLASVFFTACADHAEFRVIKMKRNLMAEDGGKGIGRVLANNPGIEVLDISFNLMHEASGAAIGRSLNRLENRELKILQLEVNRWHNPDGAVILRPLGNRLMVMPIELVDFGMILFIAKEFIDAKEKALKVHPELKIIHGRTFGMTHAAGPDLKTLLIKRADVVCKNFETPLVMLMEELAKEKHEMTNPEFRKFIKQCNLYKDKSLTESFEKVFAMKAGAGVDSLAILEAFDKVYPGLRVIPEPKDEEEEEQEKPMSPTETKKGKGKGGKGKGKAGGSAAPKASKPKGKGKKKK